MRTKLQNLISHLYKSLTYAGTYDTDRIKLKIEILEDVLSCLPEPNTNNPTKDTEYSNNTTYPLDSTGQIVIKQ